MAQLSRLVLQDIATKMTEKSKKHYELLEKEYRKLATEIYESKVPQKVMDVFKSNCEYVTTSQSLYINGHGFNNERVLMTKQLPAETQYDIPLKLNAKTADVLKIAKNKRDKAKEAYDNLLLETKSALYSLRTHKNIKENLPTAEPFLPPPMSNALVVNFDSLKKKLNKQPELETVKS